MPSVLSMLLQHEEASSPVQIREKEQQINKYLNGLSSTGGWLVVEDKKPGKGENYKTDWNWKEKLIC